ncbi:MAG: hypothetical protein KJ620_03800 [Candidatus Edwardsbacteria bacterium]|nr:hypothetical protein [Candidatus Edwardsbacteria bacterium]MBU1576041.1 hypothetical protein [Candidatus Edwardsbacteria bacterium]MBU2463064.1 hypothetical protein [Candidatus Edwardsbacteria bacterium]MBU2594300.1 hypothetical protein [Candidatus Edwardsbacteria bacterium]
MPDVKMLGGVGPAFQYQDEHYKHENQSQQTSRAIQVNAGILVVVAMNGAYQHNQKEG